jgi:hypothetical protein
VKNNNKKPLPGGLSERDIRPARVARVSAKVAKLFKECGYLRTPPGLREDGHARVGGHRGYEVRFIAHSRLECQRIVRLLKACHIETGRPFNKGQQWRVPVYGRELFVALKDSQ